MTERGSGRAAAVPGDAHAIADLSVPSPARMYDYWLGGKDNFPADREAARRVCTAYPDVRRLARANRRFLTRAVWFMAAHGIRQYIDLGTGIPTSPNVHEVARQAVAGARVVYVDNDPVVTVHSQALRAGDDGVIAISGDIRRPQDILAHPEVAGLIDFTQPVGILFISVLHFISSGEDLDGIVAAFRRRMAAGSYLAISHATTDGADPAVLAEIAQVYEKATSPAVPRPSAQIQELFTGLDLVEPGLVDVSRWRPDIRARATKLRILAGVARKPGEAEQAP
jgi:S-adenosyl methyltransferase